MTRVLLVLLILVGLGLWHRLDAPPPPLLVTPASAWRLYTTCPVGRRNVPILTERNA